MEMLAEIILALAGITSEIRRHHYMWVQWKGRHTFKASFNTIKVRAFVVIFLLISVGRDDGSLTLTARLSVSIVASAHLPGAGEGG